jgi:hypothetical protein
VGIIWAYRAAPYVPVWAPPVGLRHLAALTMLVAFLLMVVGQMTPSPTVAGLTAKRLADPEPARGILRITRHPFLMAVAVWAATHLLVRGDAASMIFFAAFLYLGVTGPIRIDRRLAREFGALRRHRRRPQQARARRDRPRPGRRRRGDLRGQPALAPQVAVRGRAARALSRDGPPGLSAISRGVTIRDGKFAPPEWAGSTLEQLVVLA